MFQSGSSNMFSNSQATKSSAIWSHPPCLLKDAVSEEEKLFQLSILLEQGLFSHDGSLAF